jgi:dihydropteroate synthase
LNFFNAGKYKLDLTKKTYVMGILNLTPDSFSDGGEWNTSESIIRRAEEIKNQGADILDIGAQSTRPGFVKISANEEWSRLSHVLGSIRNAIDIPISIDTFYPEVAKKALEYGVNIVNDVTGFKNPEMFEATARSDCGIIIMHNLSDINIKSFFKKQLAIAENYGIDPSRICLDPGIGFNKNQLQDAYIIRNISNIKIPDIALLVGLSRKRVIGANCGNPPPKERFAGTIAANTIAVCNGANIIRVHDVKEAVQAASVTDAILKTNFDNLREQTQSESDNN